MHIKSVRAAQWKVCCLEAETKPANFQLLECKPLPCI